MKAYWHSALGFVAVGLVLYGMAYVAADRVVYRYGGDNPLYEIRAAAHERYDYVVLGASHAMPLDFGDINAHLQERTGARILNLATPGNGVLYNRFAIECFLRHRTTRNALYVADSFAFYSAEWNERRFNDVKLWRTAPFDPAAAGLLARYVVHEGIAATVWLDYVSGFSKLNHVLAYEPETWEGARNFERTYRFSERRARERVAYLYPAGADPAAFERYLGELLALLRTLRTRGIAPVVMKMPVPERFHALLPEEGRFDAVLAERLAASEIPFHNFAQVANDPGYFFDTDHLNRKGVLHFIDTHLASMLRRHLQAP